jgi:hypothetical protein
VMPIELALINCIESFCAWVKPWVLKRVYDLYYCRVANDKAVCHPT